MMDDGIEGMVGWLGPGWFVWWVIEWELVVLPLQY